MIPRRSSGHMPRVTRPSASKRATTRESALWLRYTASASSCIRGVLVGGGEALEHFVLAHAESVLLLQAVLEH